MAVGQSAGAEDRLADAHGGGAFLDGPFEIPGHAHGQFCEIRALRRVLAQLVAQRTQQLEAGAHMGLVRGKQGQRHQAAYPQRAVGGQGAGEVQNLFGRQAELAGLAGRVHLHEDIQAAAGFLQAAVQGLGHAQVVQRLEFLGETGHEFGFVGLQMADHGPAQIGQVGHGFPFAVGFLDLVFAQQAAACRIGHADAGFVHGLADGQQADFGRIAAGPYAGRIDAGADVGQVGLDFLRSFGRPVERPDGGWCSIHCDGSGKGWEWVKECP